MEGNLFILERLIKVWMFLQILRKSVQESLWRKDQHFPAENARINFSVKNWFYHVTTRLDFQLSELWEMLRYKKSWEECRENSSLDLDVFAQSAKSKVSNTNTNTNINTNTNTKEQWSALVIDSCNHWHLVDSQHTNDCVKLKLMSNIWRLLFMPGLCD